MLLLIHMNAFHFDVQIHCVDFKSKSSNNNNNNSTNNITVNIINTTMLLFCDFRDRCIAQHCRPQTQNLFAIVQGGLDVSANGLRERCLQLMTQRNLPGYAIGGLAGGESKDAFWRVVEHVSGRYYTLILLALLVLLLMNSLVSYHCILISYYYCVCELECTSIASKQTQIFNGRWLSTRSCCVCCSRSRHVSLVKSSCFLLL